MASGKLKLKGKKDSKGRLPLIIYLTHRHLEATVNTPERLISLTDLDKKTQERVDKIQHLLDGVLIDFKYRANISYTVLDLKAEIEKRAHWERRSKDKDTWKAKFDEWIEYSRNRLKRDIKTLGGYDTTRNAIEIELTALKREEISFQNFNTELLDQIIGRWLDQGYEPSYIRKHLSIIRGWCEYSKHPEIGNKWQSIHPLPILSDKEPIWLTEEEVTQLYNFNPPEKYRPIKDLLFRFIASGVRWSDRDIRLDVRQVGEFVLKRNQKNNRLSAIPLNKYLLEVLEKPMPEMDIRTFNVKVKELCYLAKINTLTVKTTTPGGVLKEEVLPKWKLISSKIGRKTMVSWLTALGANDAEIGKVIGNKQEIKAYQGVDLAKITEKIKRKMGG